MSHTPGGEQETPGTAPAQPNTNERAALFALIDERLAQPNGARLFREQMKSLVQEGLQSAIDTVEGHVTTTGRPTEIKIGQPKDFNGDLGEAMQWTTSVEAYLHLNKEIYNTDEKRILFTLSFMKGGTAAAWAHKRNQAALLMVNGLYSGWGNWTQFINDFNRAFNYSDHAIWARQQLQHLKQSGNIDEFISEFRTLQGICGEQGNAALIGYFQAGIKTSLMRQIFAMEHVPTTIEGWMEKAALFDHNNRMANAVSKGNHHYTPHYQNKPSYAAKPRDPNAMDVDRISLSPEEKDRYFKESRCFECGKKGHRAAVCRSRQGQNRSGFNPPRANIRTTNTQGDPKDKTITIKALLEGMTEEEKAATFKTLGEDVDF